MQKKYIFINFFLCFFYFLLPFLCWGADLGEYGKDLLSVPYSIRYSFYKEHDKSWTTASLQERESFLKAFHAKIEADEAFFGELKEEKEIRKERIDREREAKESIIEGRKKRIEERKRLEKEKKARQKAEFDQKVAAAKDRLNALKQRAESLKNKRN